MRDIYGVESKLVDEITISDAPWVSKVRQLVNFGKELIENRGISESVGGHRRRTNKRRTNKRQNKRTK